MRTDALPRETVKPYHSNLDMYQRFMLNNPKTSLRNRMSDLSATDRPSTRGATGGSSTRGNKRHRAPNQESTQDLGADDQALSYDEHGSGGAARSGRPPRLAPIPANKTSGPQSHRSDGWGGTSNGDMTEQGDEGYPTDARDAAGYSELQAAFERAYEKMLRDPPPSIVDTVLSSAWKPNPKKSAEWRTHFQKSVHKVRDWDTRSPVYEKKQVYDALWDGNCRRVVENPQFKMMLLRTRPDSQHLFDHRVMDEEKQKLSRKKGKQGKGGERLRIRRKKKAEPWHETLERMRPRGGQEEEENSAAQQQQHRTRMAAAREMEDEEEGGREGRGGERVAEREDGEEEVGGEEGGLDGGRGEGEVVEGEEEEDGELRPLEVIEEGSREGSMLVGGGDQGSPGAGGGGRGGSAGGRGTGTDAVEEIKRAWGVTEDGVNASFNSLNAVLMSEGHRPEAFDALSQQLSNLWSILKAPEKDTAHVRRFCMGEPSATNLAHLFYQVSRWTQYHLEVVKGCDLIQRREMLLSDLLDHLALSGGVPDEALTRKLADFYAFSHTAISHVTSVKSLYPGNAASGPLLQDYIPKVRRDTVHLRGQHAGAPMPQTSNSGDGFQSQDSVASFEQTGNEYQQHKVKLAAELVLNSVQREAAAYVQMLSH